MSAICIDIYRFTAAYLERQARCIGLILHFPHSHQCQLLIVHFHFFHIQIPAGSLAGFDQIFDQLLQPIGFFMEHFHISTGCFIFQLLIFQQIYIGNDRSQRRFQVMGYIRDQLRFHSFPFYSMVNRFFQPHLNIRNVFRKIQERRRNFIQIQWIGEIPLGTFLS